MGFIGSSFARELDARAEIQQFPTDEIDYYIDIDYELELELVAEESEFEFEFKEDAPVPPDAILTNNTSDIFDLSIPKPGHTTGGSSRCARRGAEAGSSRTGCQQNCSPGGQASLILFKASKA